LVFKKIVLIIILLSVPTRAYAQNPRFYAGLDYSSFKLKEISGVNLKGGKLRLGFDINNYLALEGHAGASGADTDETTGLDYKINYMASTFIRGNLRFNRFTVYALAGWSLAEARVSGLTGAVSEDKTYNAGASYGGGMDFYGSKNTAITLSYIQYNKVEMSAFSVGFVHYFAVSSLDKRY